MTLVSALVARIIPNFVNRPGDREPHAVIVRIWWVATSGSALLSLALTVWLFAAGIPVVSIFSAIHTVFWFGVLIFYSIVRRGIEWIGLTTQTFLVASAFVFSLLIRDSAMSLGFLLLGLVGPLYAIAWPKRFRALVLATAYCVIAAVTPWLREIVPQFGSQNDIVGRILLSIAILACAISCFGALSFFVRERARALELLHAEQAKAERLLLNILPKPIAEILRNEDRVIADYYDGASVLFADVVGFTPLSEQMQPQEVVKLLNDVFSYFDKLVDKYDVEKIKTIGDCYMVAAGLPKARPDHAERLVAMALEAREHFTTASFWGGRQLSFRIGINSGPVVAGVIGLKRFIYDLWGDAVNTASRMESHGVPNAIQITEETYRLVSDFFECERRQPIEIKGKGKMTVWHVIGRKGQPYDSSSGIDR